MSLNVYEVITERIIASLEQNIVPWRMSWKASTPKNLISRKAYRGVNIFLLNASRFSSPYWLTYKQAVGKGGSVKRGEKATPVIFWSVKDKKDDPTKKSFILRYYNCFNVSQCEGIDIPAEEGVVNTFTPIEACERIVLGYKDAPAIVHAGSHACYNPGSDEISMPVKESFESAEAYYCTLMHEMSHSTGHKSRLDREGITNPIKFASHSYSYEELIAETCASFLCGEAGILDTTCDNSVAYIKSWISKLRSDPKWIIKASGEAAKAADYILGRSKETTASSDDAINLDEESIEDARRARREGGYE